MRYGIPYVGSKNSIAEWIISQLPAADVFVDLFAGGCAVTHAAMLSGKYNRFICNDISGTPYIFKEAINGDFDGYATIPDREGFLVSDDVALKLLYSFGNNQSSYLWGKQYEKIKVPAERMLTAPSIHERRMHYRAFMKELNTYIHDVVHSQQDILTRPYELQGLERLERLQGLEGLERLQGLELMVSDYRNVNIPANAVVYADPPYRGTGENYGGFDYDAFDDWLACVDHPVYVSEYTAPAGCVCIAERPKRVCLTATDNTKWAIERLFIQERFADEITK